MAAWMLYALVIGFFASAIALLVERGLVLYGKPVRWVWLAAILVTLSVPVLRPRVARAPAVENAMVASPDQATSLRPSVVDQASGSVYRVLGNLNAASVVFWLSTSILLGLTLIGSHARLVSESRRWSAKQIRRLPVHVSHRYGPAVVGFFKSIIVLPAWIWDIDRHQRNVILLHEGEHIRSRDLLLVLVGIVALIAMPWNIALWWQFHRLRAGIETDCDGRVLARGVDVRTYGHILIDMHAHGFDPRLTAVTLSENGSTLKRRIRQMTRNTPRGRLARVVGLTAFAGLLFAVACDTPFPSSPDEETQIATEVKPLQAEFLYVDIRYCEALERADIECNDLTIDRSLSPIKWRYLATTKALHSMQLAPTVEMPVRIRASEIISAAQPMWSPDGRRLVYISEDVSRSERVAAVKARWLPVREQQQ